MPSHHGEEYLLPPLSRLSYTDPDRPQTSWSPFDPTLAADADRSYIRYERAPASHQEQDVGSVGLGIQNVRSRPEVDEIHAGGESHSSLHSNLQTPRSHTSKTPLLGSEGRCPQRKTIATSWNGWVPITIMVLAVYASVGSGVYFWVAVRKPRYGNFICFDCRLLPSTADLLSALFAKTIELAYVTVFVSCLGQYLSRRALRRTSHGISISDMSMRTWIMQPGFMLVHSETLRYSAFTFLGAMTITATIVAMLYTTAAEALVSPKLIYGPYESRELQGNVFTDFFNPVYLGYNCPTPILNQSDPQHRNTTCLQMQHVGQAYHNYIAYINDWSNSIAQGESASTVLEQRPPPIGSIHDNTTVTGSWIDRSNMTELSTHYGRMVLNVTAAMPHAGVLYATKNPINGLKQPQNSSEGQFDLTASVLCPAINVLCISMTASELRPLIYDMWPGKKYDAANWQKQIENDIPRWPAWLNRTVVDNIFGWGLEYGWRPPIFPILPLENQTIVNGSTAFGNALHLLGKPPSATGLEYVLCAMKAKKTPRCSVKYTASASGARLSTDCEKPDNEWQYNHWFPEAVDGNWSLDWKNVATEWANSLSLNAGVSDGKASNARLLMQLTPSGYSLEPDLPSLAEALAVMAGSTLILGTENATLVDYWDRPDSFITEPEVQVFNTSMKVVQYQSSGKEEWRGIFFPVLALAWATSLICLGYLIRQKGRQLTDFTEPQNLFTLAINSPTTSRLDGACGVGPQKPHFKEKWYIGMEEEDEHYYIRTKAEENTPTVPMTQASMEAERPKPVSPGLEEYRQLSARSRRRRCC
ncbi:hypothetical protein BDV28DRAFT_52387 [Aspergillus coremiiformis]|uniref:Uncharacterized protein n=1 Tax=Aspergillus coremiiformis TaxID=138285 RepID=A0A5N6YZN4_9EURO|nr:hypothetical protein BDV28DRAFT_52387 [Aspergillus coremiiformis]